MKRLKVPPKDSIDCQVSDYEQSSLGFDLTISARQLRWEDCLTGEISHCGDAVRPLEAVEVALLTLCTMLSQHHFKRPDRLHAALERAVEAWDWPSTPPGTDPEAP
jgi:hypothetical protein